MSGPVHPIECPHRGRLLPDRFFQIVGASRRSANGECRGRAERQLLGWKVVIRFRACERQLRALISAVRVPLPNSRKRTPKSRRRNAWGWDKPAVLANRGEWPLLSRSGPIPQPSSRGRRRTPTRLLGSTSSCRGAGRRTPTRSPPKPGYTATCKAAAFTAWIRCSDYCDQCKTAETSRCARKRNVKGSNVGRFYRKRMPISAQPHFRTF